jgi:hypothetical protein
MININQLNKEFESRVRLGIMSVLMVNDWVDFSEMKSLWKLRTVILPVTATRWKSAYIEVKKEFVGKSPKHRIA